MSSFEIVHFDSEKTENVLLFFYCIRLRNLDDQNLVIWIKKIDDIFKIEVEELPSSVKEEEINEIIEKIFEHALTKSKYRIQAVTENWREKGYSIENTE